MVGAWFRCLVGVIYVVQSYTVTVPPTSTSVSPVSVIPPALSTHLHLSSNVTIRTSGWIMIMLIQSISLVIYRREGGGVRQKIYTFCAWGMSKMARTYLQPSAPNRVLFTPDPSQSALFVICLWNLCRSCKLLHAPQFSASCAPVSTLRDVWCVLMSVSAEPEDHVSPLLFFL